MYRRFACLAGLTVLLSACTRLVTAPAASQTLAYEVVAAFPSGRQGGAWDLTSSPDGTLFLATDHGLYRSSPGADTGWTRLVDAELRAHGMYAPSAHIVFITTGGPIYRWRAGDGLQEMHTPASDTVIGGYIYGVPLYDVWGRDSADVYAVGWDGTIIHYDGVTWTAEPTPLNTRFGPTPEAAHYDGRLQSVSGNAAGDVVASVWLSNGLLAERGAGGAWDTVRIAAPPTAAADVPRRDCGLLASAMAGEQLWLSGGDRACLIRYDLRTRMRYDHSDALSTFSAPGPFSGRQQPDGSILFWASAYGRGDVARIVGTTVQVGQFPTLAWFGGATMSRGALYAAGSLGDSTVVVRTHW